MSGATRNGVAGLILAGGEARRLGGIDKPLLTLGGRTLLSHVAAALAPHCAHLAVSANGDPARFAATKLPVLADAVPGVGPLAGLARGLDWAAAIGCATLVTVPGDTPFVPPDLVPRLHPAPATAASLGRRHHLVAGWPVSCRAALHAWIEELRHAASRRAASVRGFADTIGTREVEFSHAGADPFFNVNTPEDYETALAQIGGAR